MVKRKQGKNIPSVITTAPANAVPGPPSCNPPWNPTKVEKITKGAGGMFPIAMQSINTLCGSQSPFSTASTWINGIAVYAPPNERFPATRPRTKRLVREGVCASPRARVTGDGKPRKTTKSAKPTYYNTHKTTAGI
jgi:hypothetical protein